MGERGPIAIVKVKSGYFITLPHFAGNCAITIITLAHTNELSLYPSTLPISMSYFMYTSFIIIVVKLMCILDRHKCHYPFCTRDTVS